MGFVSDMPAFAPPSPSRLKAGNQNPSNRTVRVELAPIPIGTSTGFHSSAHTAKVRFCMVRREPCITKKPRRDAAGLERSFSNDSIILFQ